MITCSHSGVPGENHRLPSEDNSMKKILKYLGFTIDLKKKTTLLLSEHYKISCCMGWI